jgi:DNA modification methylase
MDALANAWGDLPLADWGVDLPEDWLKTDAEPKDAEAQIDRAEELNKTWGVKMGDLWQIGEHRLLCGDSTKKEDVERVMGGEKADMVFTDPPYGMNLDTDYSGIMNRGNKYEKVIGDDKEWLFDSANYYDCDEQIWWGADWYRRTLPIGGSWFVWDKQISEHDGASHTGSLFELAWSKTPHKREIIKVPFFRFYGMDTEKRLHPTQKPERLCAWFIEKFSKEYAVIADPFIGSGTTMVACQNLNRKCRGIEISPSYCAVILQRMTDAFPGIEIKKIK